MIPYTFGEHFKPLQPILSKIKTKMLKKYPNFDLNVTFTGLQIADWGMVLALTHFFAHTKFKSSRYNSFQVIVEERWFLGENRPAGLYVQRPHHIH